jgi:hypothetical protein
MSQRAHGPFVVQVTPVTDREGGVANERLTIAKTFDGDLKAESRGEMWTVSTAVEGSGAYVAIERIEGTLHDRRGTFVLVHQGTMRRNGDYDLRIAVVPDSGTDALAGLRGTMTITIAPDGAHTYDFAYDVREADE